MLPWLTFIYKFSCILTPLIWIPQRTIAALIPTEWSWISNTWSPIFMLNSSPSQTSDPQTLCCIPVLKISKKVSHETFETSKLHFFFSNMHNYHSISWNSEWIFKIFHWPSFDTNLGYFVSNYHWCLNEKGIEI